MQSRTKQNSLHTQFPELGEQWHPSKNLPLTPADVKSGSHKKVWWQCEKGHVWEAQIKSRALGKAGCPYCSGRRFLPERSLWRLNRPLSYQWHPTENGPLRPKDISASSDRKVWWRCKDGHVWQATVGSRHRDGNGCPYCAGRKACKDNSLATRRPDLAAQWHKTKNESLTPHDLTPGSNRKVWWKCRHRHAWEATVVDRAVANNGCPYCSNNRVSPQNNLARRNPRLALQWHPAKNGDLTPNDVTPGSTRKVWWVCDRGHEWPASVGKRSRGRGCPYCCGRYVAPEKSLACTHPKLASQWHPAKNKNLSPTDVTAGSRFIVWWREENGRECKEVICHRAARIIR